MFKEEQRIMPIKDNEDLRPMSDIEDNTVCELSSILIQVKYNDDIMNKIQMLSKDLGALDIGIDTENIKNIEQFDVIRNSKEYKHLIKYSYLIHNSVRCPRYKTARNIMSFTHRFPKNSPLFNNMKLYIPTLSNHIDKGIITEKNKHLTSEYVNDYLSPIIKKLFGDDIIDIHIESATFINGVNPKNDKHLGLFNELKDKKIML